MTVLLWRWCAWTSFYSAAPGHWPHAARGRCALLRGRLRPRVPRGRLDGRRHRRRLRPGRGGHPGRVPGAAPAPGSIGRIRPARPTGYAASSSARRSASVTGAWRRVELERSIVATRPSSRRPRPPQALAAVRRLAPKQRAGGRAPLTSRPPMTEIAEVRRLLGVDRLEPAAHGPLLSCPGPGRGGARRCPLMTALRAAFGETDRSWDELVPDTLARGDRSAAAGERRTSWGRRSLAAGGRRRHRRGDGVRARRQLTDPVQSLINSKPRRARPHRRGACVPLVGTWLRGRSPM